MKKPRTWRSSSRFSCNQLVGAVELLVLLLDECLFAVALLPHHHLGDVAAEVMHELEQGNGEGGVQKPGTTARSLQMSVMV